MPDQQTLDAQFEQSDIERRLHDLEVWKGQLNEAGIDRLIQSGYIQFDGTPMRWDSYGQQMQVSSGGTTMVYFVPTLSADPTDQDIRATIQGVISDTNATIAITSNIVSKGLQGGVYTYALDQVNDVAGIRLYPITPDINQNTYVEVYALRPNSFGSMVLTNTVLRIGSFTSDPATLADGDIWYRSDVDTIYARVNGSTVAVSTGGGGGVATDVIWDAKGDLAVGTGADTASKLSYPAKSGEYLISYVPGTTGLIWRPLLGEATTANGSGSTGTIDSNYRLVSVQNLSGARTIDLGSAAELGAGDAIALKNLATETQTLTIDPNSSQTIDGQTTITLGYKEGVFLGSDGSNWMVLSREQPTYWIHLTADYTLTSTTAAQKIFNTTTNGQVALPPGVYEFECFLYLTTMSATSGNAAFTLGGTATIDRVGFHVTGIDNSSPLNAGTLTGSASVTTSSVASMVSAGTGTGMTSLIEGIFRVSAGGTLIPRISLVTAAAAVVKAGSWFKCRRIGESAQTYNGAWT